MILVLVLAVELGEIVELFVKLAVVYVEIDK